MLVGQIRRFGSFCKCCRAMTIVCELDPPNLSKQKLVLFNSEKRSSRTCSKTFAHKRVTKFNWGNLRLVGEGFADSQLKRAPQERAAMLNSVTPAIVENQPPILRASQFSQTFRLRITTCHSHTTLLPSHHLSRHDNPAQGATLLWLVSSTCFAPLLMPLDCVPRALCSSNAKAALHLVQVYSLFRLPPAKNG